MISNKLVDFALSLIEGTPNSAGLERLFLPLDLLMDYSLYVGRSSESESFFPLQLAHLTG